MLYECKLCKCVNEIKCITGLTAQLNEDRQWHAARTHTHIHTQRARWCKAHFEFFHPRSIQSTALIIIITKSNWIYRQVNINNKMGKVAKKKCFKADAEWQTPNFPQKFGWDGVMPNKQLCCDDQLQYPVYLNVLSLNIFLVLTESMTTLNSRTVIIHHIQIHKICIF